MEKTKFPVAPSAEEEVILQLTLETAMSVLAGLGDRSTEIYLAYHRDGVPISELATWFHIEESSVNNRLNRAQRVIDGRVECGRLGLEKE